MSAPGRTRVEITVHRHLCDRKLKARNPADRYPRSWPHGPWAWGNLFACDAEEGNRSPRRVYKQFLAPTAIGIDPSDRPWTAFLLIFLSGCDGGATTASGGNDWLVKWRKKGESSATGSGQVCDLIICMSVFSIPTRSNARSSTPTQTTK